MLTAHYRITSIDKGRTYYAEINIDAEDEQISLTVSGGRGHSLSAYPSDPANLRKLGEDLIAAANELEAKQAEAAAPPAEATETAA